MRFTSAASAAETASVFALLSRLEISTHGVIEYDYRRTGLRREGLYAGLYSFVEKLAFATAPLTLGILLSSMGFVPGLPRTALQPESALLAITLAMAVIPAITNSLKVVLALQFKIPEPELVDRQP